MALPPTLGDLAQSVQLRRQTALVSRELTALAGELTSGLKRTAAVGAAGDFGPLAGIESDLKANAARSLAASETAILADLAELSLGKVKAEADAVLPGMLLVKTEVDGGSVLTAAEAAEHAFRATVAALNARSGDRAVFAGADLTGVALADADTMLAALDAAVAGQTTAAGVDAALDAWFAPGGGFDTTGYLGATADAGPTEVGDRVTAGVPIRADGDAARDVLRALAGAAMAARGTVAAPEERRALVAASADRLLNAGPGIEHARARVGLVQARIAGAEAANAAERSALQIARSELRDADPFETATRLQSVETQLQTIYTVTARLSRLNLTSYLR